VTIRVRFGSQDFCVATVHIHCVVMFVVAGIGKIAKVTFIHNRIEP